MDATTTTSMLSSTVLLALAMTGGATADVGEQSVQLVPVGTNKSGPIDITADGTTVVTANTDVGQRGRTRRVASAWCGCSGQ